MNESGQESMSQAVDEATPGIWVFLTHRGKTEPIRLEREINWYDEERVAKALPFPDPPLGKDGAPTFGDFGYLTRRAEILHERGIRLAAISLGAKFCGGLEPMEARVDWLKSNYKRWQLEHLAKAVNDPASATEAEIQEEMQRLFPTSAATTGNG